MACSASFDVRIQNVAQNLEVGSCARSSKLIVESCPLCLKVYPCGTHSTLGNFVSAFLEVVPRDEWAEDWAFPDVTYHITAVNKNPRLNITKKDTCSFSQDVVDRGWHDLIPTRAGQSWNEFSLSGWVIDGALCFVVVVEGPSLAREQPTNPKKCPHLRFLWSDMKYPDMVVCAEDGPELPCHRAVLATASEVFDRLFSNEMKESAERRLVIRRVSTDTVPIFLEYIYTRQLGPISHDTASELIELGDMYDMGELVQQCAKRLSESICTANLPEVFRVLGSHTKHPKVLECFDAAKKKVREDNELFDTLINAISRLP